MKVNVNVKDKQVLNSINLSDGEYVATFEKRADAHTLQQLRMLWGLIDAISISQNGDTSESMRIYLQALVESGCDTSIVAIEQSALADFRKLVKNCVVLDAYTSKHKAMVVCRVCYKGVSAMNKSEIAKVIDYVINLASLEGLYEDYNYKELRKVKDERIKQEIS
mgnify:CR=1 FL=1